MAARRDGKDQKATRPADSASASLISDEHVEDLDTMERERRDAQLTCDVLCSLSSSTRVDNSGNNRFPESQQKRKTSSKACSKQLQLPMFLSKTYHMIDRCDPTIATWSESGDNFVVKDVDKFAQAVLPLYFKHSNFSSFARQLNFYGFRKLRTDPILTTDVDPKTAAYVRFYHENFKRDQPEMLHQIRRATKTDQQQASDVESLKQEVSRLKDALASTASDYERRLSDLTIDFDRRLNAANAELEQLASLVRRFLSQQQNEASAAAAALTELPTAPVHPGPAPVPNLLQSLSQIASAANFQVRPVPIEVLQAQNNSAAGKRKASDDGSHGSHSSHSSHASATRPRLM